MELARGVVCEKPWGLTLGAFAQRALTGELAIVDGATRITLAIEDGRVVAGTSTRTTPSLLERAARTFELASGSYSLGSQTTLVRRDNSAAIDLREVIFTGARRYLDDDRLHAELRMLGTRFSLGPGGVAEIPRYGTEVPAVIAGMLRDGASLAEIELAHPSLDRRAIQALLYALVSCGAARGLLPGRAPTPSPEGSRTITPTRATPGSSEGQARTKSPNSPRTTTPGSSQTATPRTTTPDAPRTTTQRASSPADTGQVRLARIPTVNVPRDPTPPGARTPTPPPGARTPTPPPGARTPTLTPSAPPPQARTATTKDAVPVIAADDALEASRTATRRDPSPFDGGPPTVRTPLPLDPRRKPIALPDDHTRPPRATGARDPEDARSKAGRGAAASRATPSHGVRIVAPDDDATYRAALAADRARRLLEAHEHVEAQKEALVATRLVPESFDYQALHAWATFCGSRDKPAVADATRKLLEKASYRADAPHEVRMLLGRLERTVGREREALRHFRAVIEREPDHAEAAAQIRELEAQLEAFARR